jgi:hypothetical protein
VTQVQPVLQAQCGACHQAGGSGNGQRNRWCSPATPSGDFNVTLTMINDTCNAAANPLLRGRPPCRTRPAHHADSGRAAGRQRGLQRRSPTGSAGVQQPMSEPP